VGGVSVVSRDVLFEYTCDECDLDREFPVFVMCEGVLSDGRKDLSARELLPEGWQERTPELGSNYHVCADCIWRECVDAWEAA
jgi:hypothetical protein